ncbi:MAG: radical SAM family heme chaperone HemW [Bacteroidia bacterium]|nr:radical SAM family heme chaperone HemW [Bacteroidia bacterium]
MAGIYVHIPFCRSACSYCDFYFTVNHRRLADYVEAVQSEIWLRRNDLSQKIETIYFGGGTPSVLSIQAIEGILNQIFKYFSVLSDAEITLEANPEDITAETCKQYIATGINRLSLGIQSLSDDTLVRLNRRHTADAASTALKTTLSAGFRSVSADVMYGIPTEKNNSFHETIKQLLSIQVPHISAYALTVESKTKLSLDIMKNQYPPVLDEQQVSESNWLNEILTENKFERYEISNYALSGHYSKHNIGYWSRKPYLGIGAAAHSFVNQTRSWNIKPVSEYIRAVRENRSLQAGQETLVGNTIWNDFVLTKLRMKQGFTWQEAEQNFPNFQKQSLLKVVQPLQQKGWLLPDSTKIALTQEGFHFADKVITSLFL